MLLRELDLDRDDVYCLDGPLGLRDCFALVGIALPQCKDPHWSPVTPLPFQRIHALDSTANPEDGEDIFSVIRRQDLLVHHPYQSFSATVQRFITHAAHDADVLAIKITLYRTSGDSPIVKALIAAAENGKQVVALVELKARFDEANNIIWARQLEQAGVHVVYGLVGLKTHTKITMVVRRESGQIRRYVHIGTGNYNPKTARLYTDVGLLSCREDLGADLTDLFNYLTGHSRQQTYRKLLVAPVNLRSRMLALIRREIDQVRAGQEGRIVAKMNALVDPEIILALYDASQAGVSIDLIIRGMCCLRPGVPGLSDRIRVISIIGRFLEHSRLFYFHNGGQVDIYFGSADWMPRNLNRRVEAVVPIEDPRLSQDLQEILAVMLADNRQAWDLQSDGHYIQRRPAANEMERSSQRTLMEMVLQGATAT
jgi:polyphosphate kinase